MGGWGFNVGEATSWLRAGLEAGDAWLASQLSWEGITPDRLREVYTHPGVSGSLSSNWLSDFDQAKIWDRNLTLSRFFDDCLIERHRQESKIPKAFRDSGMVS
jgi:hypothetical protein